MHALQPWSNKYCNNGRDGTEFEFKSFQYAVFFFKFKIILDFIFLDFILIFFLRLAGHAHILKSEHILNVLLVDRWRVFFVC